MIHEQVVTIASRAVSFTAVCDLCADVDLSAGWESSTFAGRLDLDAGEGVFLCRRGHHVRVERLPAAAAAAESAAADAA
jgi:hypothetical protein